MKQTKTITVILAFVASLLLMQCQAPNAGNGTQTGNPTVVAMLYNQNGSAAVGVRVYIRPKKTLADTSAHRLAKTLVDTASTVTDANGRYAFDSTLDTGTYVIEGASGNNAVLIDSVVVKTTTAADTLPPDTLKPAGALKGVISLSEGGDPRTVFVLAFGIDRFARVNADGSFKFTGLAEAKYDLRLISSLDNYGVLDTNAISVKSADTTDLGTIALPFTGIPTPKNVKVRYDTLRNIVTISWNRENASLVKGFNVYRSKGTSAQFAMANKSLVTDTVFTDSLSNGLEKGATYQYYVVALDKNNNVGQNSSSVTAVIAYYVDAGKDTLFQVGDSVKLKGMVNSAAVIPAEYRWDVNGDGTNDFVSASADSLMWMYKDTGMYSAVISVKGTNNSVYTDTVKIKIIPKDTAGAPSAPRGLTLTYDTLKQIVTLTWAKNFEKDVQGYNVYRINLDSTSAALVKINGGMVTDTVYKDSTGIQDMTYEYRIAAVDGNAVEGTKSAGVSVKVVGALAFVDSIGIGILQKVRDVIVRTDNRIFVADDTTGFAIFSSNGIHQTTRACSSFAQVNLKRVFQMAEDNKGNLYVTGLKDQIYGGKGVILKFSPQDSLLLVFGYNGGTDSALGFPMGITVSDTFVYVENTDDRKIKVFSSNTGAFLFSFGGAGSNQGQFVEIKGLSTDPDNHIWILEEKRIQKFDQMGTLIGSFAINIGIPAGLCITKEGEIYTFSATNKSIFGFSSSGDIFSKFTPGELSSALLFIDNSGAFYLSNMSYSFVTKYE